MSTTQPIRKAEELNRFKDYYAKDTPTDMRNRLLILMGLNTALRVTDMLRLKWDAVYDYERKRQKTHLELTEQKTGKQTRIALNGVLQEALCQWMEVKQPAPKDYIFESARSRLPIDRHQAYRIVRKAAVSCGLSDHISCHSLRKTFGYHAWKLGVPPAVLMHIYNHSSYRMTLHYLCIDQDDKDEVFQRVQL